MRLWQAVAAIRDNVDLPAPGMPTKTIEARESKMRALSVGDVMGGAGVNPLERGDDCALDCAESSSRMAVKVRFVPRIEGMADGSRLDSGTMHLEDISIVWHAVRILSGCRIVLAGGKELILPRPQSGRPDWQTPRGGEPPIPYGLAL